MDNSTLRLLLWRVSGSTALALERLNPIADTFSKASIDGVIGSDNLDMDCLKMGVGPLLSVEVGAIRVHRLSQTR